MQTLQLQPLSGFENVLLMIQTHIDPTSGINVLSIASRVYGTGSKGVVIWGQGVWGFGFGFLSSGFQVVTNRNLHWPQGM